MATIAEHITARNDTDLLARLTAAAEREGVDAPAHWAASHVGRLVSVDIGETTISDVHAYAVATYEPTPRPGENPAAVTDSQIEAAVAAVRSEQTGG